MTNLPTQSEADNPSKIPPRPSQTGIHINADLLQNDDEMDSVLTQSES